VEVLHYKAVHFDDQFTVLQGYRVPQWHIPGRASTIPPRIRTIHARPRYRRLTALDEARSRAA